MFADYTSCSLSLPPKPSLSKTHIYVHAHTLSKYIRIPVAVNVSILSIAFHSLVFLQSSLHQQFHPLFRNVTFAYI